MLSRKIQAICLLVIMTTLAACQPAAETPVSTVEPVVPTVAPVPTETPERVLTICLGQEPSTLYPLGAASRSAWSVLEAVYDGPFDTRQYQVQPVILSKLPSLADGDASLAPVEVTAGENIVDINGDLVTAASGVQVLPSGCSSPDCAVVWDGASPLQLDQLSVKFTLKENLLWSDGSPLTAADSIYTFQLESDPDTPVIKVASDRTASYQALDERTVQWVGKPGYVPHTYETLFRMPLPQHIWENFSAADLVNADVSAVKPMGWGPYVIDEWVKGDHITLSKNPSYFRASEGLPRFDKLVFRFLGEQADNNLIAVQTGECDLMDEPPAQLTKHELETILALQESGKAKAFIVQGPEWEHVDFGITPTAYDDGYNAYGGERPNFFSDVRMRKAFASCMDRTGILQKLLYNQTSIPTSFLPPDHPLYSKDLPIIPFNPQEGIRLLEEVGWLDLDGDPATPRTASGVVDILEGTPLAVNYITSEASLRGEVAQKLAESMAQCGIQVNVQTLPQGELYAPGPQGPLFGRQFDLAQFAWSSGRIPPCQFYESSQIPNSQNNWLGANIAGYNNQQYDAACQAARQTHPADTQNYQQRYTEVQRLFAEELPVVPLFFRVRAAAARPDFCGLEMDTTARSNLWNIEAFDYGEGCQ